MAIHRPLVQMTVPDARPRRDDTIGEDDLLCTRWRGCVLCGKRGGPLDQCLITVGPLCLAAVRCLQCANADPQMTALHAFLAQRYGNYGKEET